MLAGQVSRVDQIAFNTLVAQVRLDLPFLISETLTHGGTSLLGPPMPWFSAHGTMEGISRFPESPPGRNLLTYR